MSHTPFCRHYYVENACKISAKKKNKSMVVGARQSFGFFRQKACFLGNNRYQILYNLISTTKL